ncbi:uncharacterized protein FOMMEDRAFT_165377 [Fomitiporia mediterranea MF3/22]|uniref:uncharacterized protein n=1 Tax=Fomitiporia mediterranea (strain MF3/22) TaxID=694068 RepID=UPI0004408CC4|nr:uncharacterized protein FOMMEDRAFT_165377 [Fomitiporia mediterranea MF3/22]EJD06635.1 hypothetical protein FOMMEDRAFT_165377 [Fomitiporia mediterranea MF3/22]
MAQRPPTTKPRGVCMYFRSGRGCRNGDMCKFLHGDGETLSPYDKSKVCRFYASGFCKHGSKCWFRHESRPNTVTLTETEAGTSTRGVNPSEMNKEDQDKLCSICQEKPVTYGLLEDCSHVFCLECIRGWRDPTGKSQDLLESGNTKKCPYCRASSNFVIPSSVYYSAEEPKKAIVIASYKSSMARIPCKYFEMSPPNSRYCPFGRDCFYQHKEADGSPYVFDRGVDYYMSRRRRSNRLQNASISDLLSNIRASRTENDVLQLMEDLRARFDLTARGSTNDGEDSEVSHLAILLEDVLTNLGEALMGTFTSSSEDGRPEEEERSTLSRPSILATPEDSSINSSLPLTRAFMDNNMSPDNFDLIANMTESESDDGTDEGTSTQTFVPHSRIRSRSLPNLTNTWADELMSASDSRPDVAEGVYGYSIDNRIDSTGIPTGEALSRDEQQQFPAVVESISISEGGGADSLGAQESSSQRGSDGPLVMGRGTNDHHSSRITVTPSSGDEVQLHDREVRSKTDVRSEHVPRRIKSNTGGTSCSGRRNGGQSFVTDGRGRVVATDDGAHTDDASLAFWSPSVPVAASPSAPTSETDGRLTEEAGALDDLD